MQTLQDTTATAAQASSKLREESLPFTVRLVQDETDLGKALQMRQSAYDRHVPEMAQSLGTPEQFDYDPGTVVLLAESKLDDEPLGTMRIQTNQYQPLWLEHSVTLPDWLQGRKLAEATRLGIVHGRVGRVVKTALFKAYYLYCLQADVEWMVIAGRSPLDRQYEALLFQEVFPGQGFMPMRHAGNLPHRVMALKVDSVEPSWREAAHPLYSFFFHTRHPDIRISTTGSVEKRPATGTHAIDPLSVS